MTRAREYQRAEVAEVPALEAAGWRVVAATVFAEREVSVLLVRELGEDPPVDEQLELGGGSR